MHITSKIIAVMLAIMSVMPLRAADNNDTDRRYRYLYIEAIRQKEANQFVTAFELLRLCHQLKPDASETNYELSIYYLALGQDSIGIQLLQRAVEAEPGNAEFAERLAQTYLYRNRIKEATEVYERLTQLMPDRTEYLEMLIRIHEQQRDYSALLDALTRYEIKEGQNESLTLAKMHVHSMLGNQEGAYNELKSLVDAHPSDLNLQVMMGNWLLQNNRKDEALNIFTSVLREEPNNARGQMSLMDYYRAEGNIQQADSMLYGMLVNPQTDAQTRVTLMRDWVRDSEEKGGDSVRIMDLFNRVLAMPQTTTEVAEMRMAYLELKKAPRDSIRNSCMQVLAISPENVGARLRLIQMMWQDSIDENVIRECRTATEYVPDEPVLYYYLGLAQYINEHTSDAIASLRRGAQCINNETPSAVSADIYLMLGDALQKEKRTDEAFIAYDSCLVYDPDRVMCLNNYAYFLSCSNRDLKKAEKMSYRAITVEANSSTYLDTYAWILYQQKRYNEARFYIDRAIECDTLDTEPNGEILDHAGDIYFQLGMKTEALDFWNRALPLGSENDALLRKKIKKGKLVKK